MTAVKKILKVVGVVVIVLVVLLVVARIFAPSIIVGVANSQIPKALTAKGGVKGVDLGLMRGRVAVQGINIEQPPGFDGPPLAQVGEVRINVKLSGSPITVQELVLEDVVVNIIKDINGVMNTEALIPAPQKEAPAEPAAEQPAAPPPEILVERIQIKNLTLTYRDLSFGGEPLEIVLTDVSLLVTNLIIDASREGEEVLPGGLLLTASLPYADAPEARLGLSGRIGIIGTKVPPVNAVLRLAGFELKSAAAAVPAGVATALGGDCLDVIADVAMRPDMLDCDVAIQSAGTKLRLGVGGTPDKPVVDKSGTLFGVLGFAGGGAAKLAGNVGSAGADVGAAALSTASTVGKGAGKLAGSLGKGLLGTVKKAASGEFREAGSALTDTAKGVAGDVTETLGEASGEVVSGAREAAASGAGVESRVNWRAGKQQRWDTEWAVALADLAQRPFPTPEGQAHAKPEGKTEAEPGAQPEVAPATEDALDAPAADDAE